MREKALGSQDTRRATWVQGAPGRVTFGRCLSLPELQFPHNRAYDQMISTVFPTSKLRQKGKEHSK